MELYTAQIKAKELISKYCPTWSFKFDGSKRRFGLCSYRRKLISLSRYLVALNNETEVIDTILHEIAHAMEYDRHGSSGHGSTWKSICLEIGAQPKRCYDSHTIQAPQKQFKGVCPGCSQTIYRHRRRNIACNRCCNGVFNADFKFVWTAS